VPTRSSESDFVRRRTISAGEKCAGCKRELGSATVTAALGKLYHSNCFKCYKCREPLEGSQYAPHGTHPLCNTCALSRMAEKCAACGERVLGTLVIALRRNWHPECLVCCNCKTSIANSDKVYRRGKYPCCPSCVETVFSDRFRPSSGRFSKSSSSSKSTASAGAATPPAARRTGQQLLESISNLLSEDVGVDYFLRFSVRDYSVENILFWLDVHQYRSIEKPLDLEIYSKSIYHKYVQVDSDLEINIDSSVRTNVEDRLAAPTTELFDEALRSIVDLMTVSSLFKFRSSPECAEMLRVWGQ